NLDYVIVPEHTPSITEAIAQTMQTANAPPDIFTQDQRPSIWRQTTSKYTSAIFLFEGKMPLCYRIGIDGKSFRAPSTSSRFPTDASSCVSDAMSSSLHTISCMIRPTFSQSVLANALRGLASGCDAGCVSHSKYLPYDPTCSF